MGKASRIRKDRLLKGPNQALDTQPVFDRPEEHATTEDVPLEKSHERDAQPLSDTLAQVGANPSRSPSRNSTVACGRLHKQDGTPQSASAGNIEDTTSEVCPDARFQAVVVVDDDMDSVGNLGGATKAITEQPSETQKPSPMYRNYRLGEVSVPPRHSKASFITWLNPWRFSKIGKGKGIA